MSEENFDFKSFKQKAIAGLYAGQRLGGKDGVLAPLIKELLEAALEGELAAHLAQEQTASASSGTPKNRRNGKQRKQMKSEGGGFELSTPRDRNATFEPQLVPKRETWLGEGTEEQIIALYARGMSYSDIQRQLLDLYGIEVSTGFLSSVTDKVIPQLQAWQQRPLSPVYAFVWFDAIHYKVRVDGQVVPRAVYVALGVNALGHKEVLGLYLHESEGAHFWRSVLVEMQNRGVQDILIASIDNLKGFADAVEAIFPRTQVQLCIVHQVRNTMQFIPAKYAKPFLAALKLVYKAPSKAAAEANLAALQRDWGERYPAALRSWVTNWDRLSAYFAYPERIRRVIYTTNTVEAFNRQLRQATKTKGAFPSETALMKLLYLAVQQVSQRHKFKLFFWGDVQGQLMAYFPGRLEAGLNAT